MEKGKDSVDFKGELIKVDKTKLKEDFNRFELFMTRLFILRLREETMCCICYSEAPCYGISSACEHKHAYCVDCIIRWSKLSSGKAAEQQQRRLGSHGGTSTS